MKKWLIPILMVMLATVLFSCGKNDYSERKNPVPSDGISQTVIKSIKENDAKLATEKNDSNEVQKNSDISDQEKKEEEEKDAKLTQKDNKKNIKDTDESGAAKESKAEETQKKNADSLKKPNEPKKDKYSTDPVPANKPKPVEPEDTKVVPTKKLTATLSILCVTILDNMDKFNKDKLSVLPEDGVIMKKRTIEFSEGESVLDVLKRETRASKIHMEMEFYPAYNSAYIEGINNIYEFDCGELSGWMFKVNGWFPNYGSSRYLLKDGDIIEWVYTCDLGRDVGGYVEGVENQ